MRFVTWALVSTAVLALAACAEERSGTARSGEPRATRLIIRESLPAMPVYIEGSVSFLRVVQTGSGEVLADGRATDGVQVRGRDALFSRAVEPGEYRLVSYQRSCNGNCGILDPPSDRCDATVRVPAGDTLTATVVLGQNGGCTVRERSELAPTAATPQTAAQVKKAHRKNVRWARAQLPGMPEARARAAAKARGLDLRAVRRDGLSLVLTDDYVLTRVNVELQSGRVTRVTGLF